MSKYCTRLRLGRRGMAAKAPNRAAVHGVKLPAPDVIPVEKVEEDIIKRAIGEKERKRREIEDGVDSQLINKWESQMLDHQ